MIKVVLFLVIVLLLSQTINAAYEQEWKVAKAKYGLAFKDWQAERKAFNTYARNMEMIEQKNAMGNLGYELGENQLTHLTEQEIQEQYLVRPGVLSEFLAKTYNIPAAAAAVAAASTTTKPPTTTTTAIRIPNKANFSYAFVTAKNQKQCGSCYTFAATAVMESQYYLKYGAKISLSEQQLLDCTYNNVSGNFGCDGGWSDKCLKYASLNGMIKTSDYAYLAKLQTCPNATIQSISNRVYVSQSGYVSSAIKNEIALKSYVALNGPISVYIQAVGDFFSYKSGIMNNSKCVASDGYINHAVALVGYGRENGTDFWLIRNSWGTTWGMNGYAKMIRNSNNNCRIASYPIYAKVK